MASLMDYLSGGNGSPYGDALGGNLSPTGTGLLAMIGAAGAANPPQAASRLPLAKPSPLYVLSQALGAYPQGYGHGLEQQDLGIQNQLNNLNLQGWLNMHRPPGAQGQQQPAPGGMPPMQAPPMGPPPSMPPSAAPPAAQVPLRQDMQPPPPMPSPAPEGPSPMPQGVPQLPPQQPPTIGKTAPIPLTKGTGSASAQPLFDIPTLVSRYQQLATFPGGQQQAAQLLSLIQKGLPEGMMLMSDGSLVNRQGLIGALGEQKGAEEWAKVAPQQAINEAKPVELRGPGSVYFNPRTNSGVQVANEINSVNPNTGAKEQQFVPIGVTPFGPQAASLPYVPGPGQGPRPGPVTPPGMPPSQAAPPAQQGTVGAPPIMPGATTPFMTALPPGRQHAEEKLGQDFGEVDKKGYDAANLTLGSVTNMVHAFDAMNAAGGWMSPGAGANMRGEFAKWVNTTEQTLNIKPTFDPNAVGNWEAMNKNTKIMGLQVVNQYLGGSREAASIITGTTSAVPGAENTPMGFRLVASGIEQTAQRARDLYDYKANLLTQNKGLVGAETAFNKANPPSLYTKKAIANAIPDQAVNALQADPSRGGAFDKKYGSGMAAFIAQGGRSQLGAAGMQ